MVPTKSRRKAGPREKAEGVQLWSWDAVTVRNMGPGLQYHHPLFNLLLGSPKIPVCALLILEAVRTPGWF